MVEAEKARQHHLTAAQNAIRFASDSAQGKTNGVIVTPTGLDNAIKRLMVGSHVGRVGTLS